jgi:hypothetical protein
LSLFPTILLVWGKVNFSNLSRYSEVSERTYRRQYSQSFNFMQLNAVLIEEAVPIDAVQIGAMDCSFVPKSGKQTYGLDWFYNGSASRTQKGLEISVIAVVDVTNHRAYSLSVQQTPANIGKRPSQPCPPAVDRPTLERVRQMLQQLPDKPTTTPPQRQTVERQTVERARQILQQLPDKSQPSDGSGNEGIEGSRIDHYLKQLRSTRPYLPSSIQYWVVDGFYAKKKFVDGVLELDLAVISKLRADANMRYLYTGVQKPRGARRQYDGKVDLTDLTRWTDVKQLEPQVNLYTTVVWHVSLKHILRLACVVDTRKAGKTGYVLLFSTDIHLNAEQILQYYQARFQIEFVFRDSKQFTGLCDAQTRDPKRLDFHFNASLTTLNLAKYQDQLQPAPDNTAPAPSPFSMASYKRIAFNQHLLEQFIHMLDLDPTLIKSHPNYQNLLSYGIIGY